MKIKVEPFIMKKGNRVAKAAIEFEATDGLLAGFHLVGFTICDDKEKGMFVLFPAVNLNPNAIQREMGSKARTFFFLRPERDEQIGELETAILNVYESMMEKFNTPHVVK